MTRRSVSVGVTAAFFSLVHAGDTLTVDANLNCDLTGPIAADRSFDASCTVSGGCTEAYRLVGTFSDDNTWSADLSATFTETNPGDCLDCVDGLWTLTGVR